VDLLPTIQKYFALRRSIASQKQRETSIAAEDSIKVDSILPPNESSIPITESSTPRTALNGTQISSDQSHSPTKLPGTPKPKKPSALSVSLATPRTSTPMSIPPERLKPPLTTREMLNHMAWLSEEILRASEEKVNLAQAANDSVSPLK
jgi:hypothetical protein